MRFIITFKMAEHTDNEISALCGEFIKAMERSKPFSPEWKLAQWSVDTLLRERSRRLRRITPGWS